MEKNTNVKSLAAIFNAVPAPMEDTENYQGPPGLKGIQARRAGFENLNNTAGVTPKKPSFPKPAQPVKPSTEDVKPSFARPGGIGRISGSFHAPNQEPQVKPTIPKPPGFKPPDQHKEEPKALFPKPINSKPFVTTNSSQEPKFGGVKPSFPPQANDAVEKPAFRKPSEVKALNAASANDTKPTFNNRPQYGAKPPAPSGENNSKPNSLAAKTISGSQDNKWTTPTKEPTEENASSVASSTPFPGVKLRPTGIKPLQSPFLEQNTAEQNDKTKSNIPAKDFLHKKPQENNSAPPMSNFPRGQSTGHVSATQNTIKDPSEPKRKPLPHPATLGPPPAKPPRPPNVDLERFRGGKGNGVKMPVSERKSSALSSALPPPPPPGNSSKPPAPPPQAPGLPSRNIGLPPEPTNVSEEDNYDDVDGEIPPYISEESEEEFYEGIDDRAQHTKEQEEENEKQKRKRLEQAKKEQKEKEKKEQEIRKRFKLPAKFEVLHQARACLDYKGGKNELSFKNGDQIEIIRIADNPEGKWLGRMKGNYGYIKTTMVNIDYDSLKRKQSTLHRPVKVNSDPEIYDDVGEQDSNSSHSTAGSSYFPPPPSNDDEIYDGIDEDPSDRSHSSLHESDVYDDVESSDFPPPPDIKSPRLGSSTDNGKRIEKEEKEFRKKFKFSGDIRVLSSVQVIHNLTTKKWGSKDLHLKAGETLDVIQHTNDTTLLCKNTEGKYGYVLRSNIIDTDGEIYDDIGEGCIYDND